jgi:hypothetical protein
LDLSLLLRYFVDPTSAFGILTVVEVSRLEDNDVSFERDEDEARLVAFGSADARPLMDTLSYDSHFRHY